MDTVGGERPEFFDSEPVKFIGRNSCERRQTAGWVAVSISVAIASFWAFWGSIENFHEGWFYTSIWRNLALMFVQYLSPMLVVIVVSSLALRWPRLSVFLFGFSALAVLARFRGSRAAVVLIAIPLFILGALYHFGRPQPYRWAKRYLIGIPFILAILCGAYPGWRAIHRQDDGNYGIRPIEGNGVALIWAPEGPGWPSNYASWQQARRSCAYLTADGRSLSTQEQNLWRLPTVDEAVRSMVFRGRNAGGVWNPVLHQAQYRVTPDKDSPLWKVHSQVIYWWTDTQVAEKKAYRIAYNGAVFPFEYRGWGNYWAYRCVQATGTAGTK